MRRPGDLAARIGGEEFAVLLPDTDGDGAMRIAGKLHDAVATLSVTSAGLGAGSVTVSIGLAVDASVGHDMGDRYRRADAALYGAKAGGRNRTRCADSARASDPKLVALRLVNARHAWSCREGRQRPCIRMDDAPSGSGPSLAQGHRRRHSEAVGVEGQVDPGTDLVGEKPPQQLHAEALPRR